MRHKINVHEGSATKDAVVPEVEVERLAYEVVNPLFKNGKKYETGSTIQLDEATAASFLNSGDIKEKS